MLFNVPVSIYNTHKTNWSKFNNYWAWKNNTIKIHRLSKIDFLFYHIERRPFFTRRFTRVHNVQIKFPLIHCLLPVPAFLIIARGGRRTKWWKTFFRSSNWRPPLTLVFPRTKFSNTVNFHQRKTLEGCANSVFFLRASFAAQ